MEHWTKIIQYIEPKKLNSINFKLVSYERQLEIMSLCLI